MSSTPKFYDRMMETTPTTGTGTYTLAGAVTGFQSYAALGNGNSAYYCAQEVDANGNPSGGWEIGIGTYTLSGTTLSRDSILSSSNSNAAVNWTSGTRRIFSTLPAGGQVWPGPALGIGTLPATGSLIHVVNASATGASTGQSLIYGNATVTTPAVDATMIGAQGYVLNNGSVVGTTGHHIGVAGIAQDTTAGRIILYGVEGKAEGRGTAGTQLYAGGVFFGNFVGSAFAGSNYGIRILANVTTDGTTPLAQGLNVGVNIESMLGGATKYAIWARDVVRGDNGFVGSNLNPLDASGNNQAGSGLVVTAGLSTGTGSDGGVLFRTVKPGVSGSSANTAQNHEFWQYQSATAEDKRATIFTENGAQWIRGAFSEEITLNTGGATSDSVNNLLPATAVIEAVVARITQTITGPLTVWNLGDPTTGARFVNTTSTLTVGSVFSENRIWDPTIAVSTATGPTQANAAKVRIAADAAAGAGKIRVTVFYRQFVAPTS